MTLRIIGGYDLWSNNGYIAPTTEARIRNEDATKVSMFTGEDEGGEEVGSGVGLGVDSTSVPTSGEVVVAKGKAVDEVPVVGGTPTKSSNSIDPSSGLRIQM